MTQDYNPGDLGFVPAHYSQGFVPLDYFDALYGPDEAQVTLASGAVMRLRRAGLGRHFRLHALGREIGKAPLERRVDLLAAWLRAAGVGAESLALEDLPAVIAAVRGLNAARGRLAWDLFRGDEEPKEEKYADYAGRDLARVVDALARHYGWALADVLEMPPEAAFAHLQECVLADRRRREWEHLLSEIAWEYDKGSKTMRYRPLPPLEWERQKPRRYGPVPEWIREKYYPQGVVIDLENVGKDNGQGAAGPRD